MSLHTEIYIKGMVCHRCVAVIKSGISLLGFEVHEIALGKVSLTSCVDKDSLVRISNFLTANGFEVIADKNKQLVEKVKEILKDCLEAKRSSGTRIKFSSLLAQNLNMNYALIGEIFSKTEGITLEKYIINLRIKEVERLLLATDLSITEITRLTGYGTINHLSHQFKELTGYSPSLYKTTRRLHDQLL